MTAPSLRLHTDAAIALERGEVLFYQDCPFPIPQGDDRHFLCQQRLSSSFHKNISFNPQTRRLTGFARQSEAQADRLQELLAAFSQAATTWLTDLLPRYAAGYSLDRATLRPEEEATRRLRHNARNDLLHLDAFPSRPSQGRRILRLFVNVNETEPRVWVTSETFAQLLERYGPEVGLQPGQGATWLRQLGANVLRLFQPGRPTWSSYDTFMRRFHHFLKAHDDFQERAPRRFHAFPPGSAWLVCTDGLSHAELRGQYALEHSWFLAPQTLVLPEQAPAAILERAGGHSGDARAA